eukprot:GILK01004483.1.p1 GENE.GILK01004483.1~~GILK01004483.1.p1  ORF type:complete len:475 (-),score=51.01 GILK01004483.1:141-1529(-)
MAATSALSRQRLYQMIYQQLLDDGFPTAAAAVAEATVIQGRRDFAPHRLAQLVQRAILIEKGSNVHTESWTPIDLQPIPPVGIEERVLDLNSDEFGDNQGDQSVVAEMRVDFTAMHKGASRVARYSHDGQWIATGSADTTVKLLDVKQIQAATERNGSHQESQSEDGALSATDMEKPVVRTFLDHSSRVNDVEFHPRSCILVSASRDSTIKFFDYTKASSKRSFRHIQETHEARCVRFHPSGDFLLVGTSHPMLRLYDVNTFQCFTAAKMEDHHRAGINQIRFSSDGSIFASCSKDGSIKLWDLVSNACVNTIPQAHLGADVTSIHFSRNNKYLLSAGKDSICRLWDLFTGTQLRAYTGAQQQKRSQQVCFSQSEDFILSSDEASNLIIVWNARTGETVKSLPGHTSAIRHLSASPVDDSLVTASDDGGVRLFSPIPASGKFTSVASDPTVAADPVSMQIES